MDSTTPHGAHSIEPKTDSEPVSTGVMTALFLLGVLAVSWVVLTDLLISSLLDSLGFIVSVSP